MQQEQGVSEMPPSMLISAAYDNLRKLAVLKFYDPEKRRIVQWADATGHKPYCYSRLSPGELDSLNGRDDVLDIREVRKYDLLKDREITVSKITVADPLAIGGTKTDKSIRNMIETWESDIKYYENYLYDRSLVVGKYYAIERGELVPRDPEIPAQVRAALKELLWDKFSDGDAVDSAQYREFVDAWANLLNQPIPEIRRISLDIEVESETGRIPDPKIAEKRVTAIGFDGTGGFKKVFVLRRDGVAEGHNELPQDVEVVLYDEDKEIEMIRDAFEIISDSVVLTYNGDDFDMPYLYNRAERLGIPNHENPLYMMRDSATLRRGVHVDLYKTFSNRAFQIYAFGAKYSDYSLNSVSLALLGEGKVEYEGELGDLSLYGTANYCYNDARLTHELTTFNNNVLMDLLVVISRIAKMPIDDVSRIGVSNWIRSLLYYEHRQRNALIPKRDELERKSLGVTNDAVIKDKKYRGGLVVEPEEGIHFDVTVMDFASLYPSIIKVNNLSYETVRCPHEGCRKNTIPGTNHWTCARNNGMTSMLIGSLRDLRVNYYKSISKNASLDYTQRQQYTVVSQALKVILNASYGVMGAEIFPLYFLPVAEATTAIGRHIIMRMIDACAESETTVLYGDSVPGETPVLIKDTGGRVRFVPIRTMHDGKGTRCIGEGSVWTDEGFQPVHYVYRRRARKPAYRIRTAKAYVECTEDHSLVVDGRLASPKDLSAGDRVDLIPYTGGLRSGASTGIGPEIAWLLGYGLASGRDKFLGTGRRWEISDLNVENLERCGVALALAGFKARMLPGEGNDSRYRLVLEDSVEVREYLRNNLFPEGEPAVPGAVLESGTAARKSFIEGARAGGWLSNEDTQGRGALLAGLCTILDGIGRHYKLSAGGSVLHLVLEEEKEDRESDIILEIQKFDLSGYVYDIETGNHHFCGGVGGVLLHNTDSLFLKKPTESQIRTVMERAKRDYGVDLEIDKEYRYVVFSTRKKNYLGVTHSGKVDVKGLTGKKSHTPPFIKTLFTDLIGILSKVENTEGFTTAKKEISEKIAACGRQVEAREIELDQLAFNVMISKEPSEYVVMPQHVKAAKMLTSREIKKGDIVSYVKIINKPGVKPVEMARKSEIDSKKYMDFMETTLMQITAPMGLDFDEIMNKPKQTGLDEFFY